jgi:hypothetical protein
MLRNVVLILITEGPVQPTVSYRFPIALPLVICEFECECRFPFASFRLPRPRLPAPVARRGANLGQGRAGVEREFLRLGLRSVRQEFPPKTTTKWIKMAKLDIEVPDRIIVCLTRVCG